MASSATTCKDTTAAFAPLIFSQTFFRVTLSRQDSIQETPPCLPAATMLTNRFHVCPLQIMVNTVRHLCTCWSTNTYLGLIHFDVTCIHWQTLFSIQSCLKLRCGNLSTNTYLVKNLFPPAQYQPLVVNFGWLVPKFVPWNAGRYLLYTWVCWRQLQVEYTKEKAGMVCREDSDSGMSTNWIALKPADTQIPPSHPKAKAIQQ